MEKKKLSEILFSEGLIKSFGEGRRLSNCGALRWDGTYVTNIDTEVEISDGKSHTLTIGKRVVTIK